MRKLIYLANIRFPTEKAHGYQISQMCQSFKNEGKIVELWVPNRKNFVQTESPQKYYSLSSELDVKYLKTLDPLKFSKEVRLPKLMLKLGFQTQTTSFIISVLFHMKENLQLLDDSLFYTRDFYLAFILKRIFGKKIRLICEIHQLPQKRLSKTLFKFMLHQNIVFITITDALKEELTKLLGVGTPILTSPDAVDLSRFRNEIPKEICRENLRLPKNRFIIGYVGKFETNGIEKGLAGLIKASKTLYDKDLRPYFLFVGGPIGLVDNYRKIVEDLKLKQSDFEFRGHQEVDKIPSYLWSCDLLTIPLPRNEFFAKFVSPLKLFEYMAAKRPILASNLPSISEILEDQKSAFLYQPDNEESLANVIIKTMSDESLANRISSLAWNKVQNMTWDNRVKKIINFEEKNHSK